MKTGGDTYLEKNKNLIEAEEEVKHIK